MEKGIYLVEGIDISPEVEVRMKTQTESFYFSGCKSPLMRIGKSEINEQMQK